MGLRVIFAKGDDPARPLANEGEAENKIGQIAPTKRNQRQECDRKAVAIGDRCVKLGECPRAFHQFEPKVNQFIR